MNGFNDSEDIIKQFGAPEDALTGAEIFFACYAQECYEGEAYVLFKKDGKLFEAQGSHCSCYGLEGQWSPEETTVEAIEKRLDTGYGIVHRQSHNLKPILESLKVSKTNELRVHRDKFIETLDDMTSRFFEGDNLHERNNLEVMLHGIAVGLSVISRVSDTK